MDNPTAIHYAKLVSFPTAFILAGYSLAFSQNAVPLIYDVKPQISARIFKGVFKGGAAVVPAGALLSATTSAYLAYLLPERRRAWATVAVAVLATQPWTVLVMLPGINRLMEISESDEQAQAKVEQTLEHRQLMKAWVRQNWVRAAMYLTGGMAGLYAALGA